MSAKKHIPFGYHISNGIISINDNEARVVKEIFSCYLDGSSYLTIAKKLISKNIQYSSKSNWNKSTIGRILKNVNYLGNDVYPRIVERQIFDCVCERANKTYTRKKVSYSDEDLAIKSHIYCAKCENPASLRYDHWVCTKCASVVKIKNDTLIRKLTDIINKLIVNPDSIDATNFIPYSPTLEIRRLENEINRELDKIESNEEYIKTLTLSLANIKYSICDDGSDERSAKQINQYLQESKTSEKLNIELMKKTLKKIIVTNDGDFFIVLKSGQKIR